MNHACWFNKQGYIAGFLKIIIFRIDVLLYYAGSSFTFPLCNKLSLLGKQNDCEQVSCQALSNPCSYKNSFLQYKRKKEFRK